MTSLTYLGFLDQHRVTCGDCDLLAVFDDVDSAVAAYRDHDCHVITPDGWCAVHSTADGPARCLADGEETA